MSNSTISPKKDIPDAPDPMVTNSKVRTVLYVIFRILLPLTVLVVGGVIAINLLKTGPQAKPMPKKKGIAVVRTIPAKFGTYQTIVEAMGVVKAAQSIELKPQVSGEVITLSDKLVPGGTFTKGDRLLQIDPRDYELSVKQKASGVAQAKSDLDLEEGNQIVARRELALLGEQVTESEEKLMLRQPQLTNLRIQLEIAEAQHEQAQLNLSRTNIQAPFNGIVQTRDVNIGTWVSTSTSLATLIGSDSYWVEVSVPEDQLKWITFPNGSDAQGAGVKVYNPTAWTQERYRTGRVIQLMPTLETEGRMARVLIEINDPLAIKPDNKGKPRALIGSFVRVSIEGKPVAQALELPREYLRDGKNLWVLSGDGTLDIRKVSIVFRDKKNVLVTAGISQGEELIVSGLSTPIGGMKIQKSGGNLSTPGSGKKRMGKQANKMNNSQGVKK